MVQQDVDGDEDDGSFQPSKIDRQAGPGRKHYYWQCPAAQAIANEIRECLGEQGGQLHRRHIWLAEAPPGQSQEPWAMVSTAALAAMEGIRRRSLAQHLEAATHGPPAMPITQLSLLAVTLFWAHLHEFCTLALAPRGWRGQTCAFFAWDAAASKWRITKQLAPHHPSG